MKFVSVTGYPIESIVDYREANINDIIVFVIY